MKPYNNLDKAHSPARTRDLNLVPRHVLHPDSSESKLKFCRLLGSRVDGAASLGFPSHSENEFEGLMTLVCFVWVRCGWRFWSYVLTEM